MDFSEYSPSPVSHLPSDYYINQQQSESYYSSSYESVSDSVFIKSEEQSQSLPALPTGGNVCILCREQFSVLRGLINHLKQVHGWCYCGTCDLSFETVDEYFSHLQSHYTNVSPLYDDRSLSPFAESTSYYEEGLGSATERSVGRNDLPLAGAARKFSCDICHREFVRKGNLENHMKNMHPVSLGHDIHMNDDHNTTAASLTCTYCNKSYKRRGALYNHIQSKHNSLSNRVASAVPNMDDPNHYCASCNKTYSGRNSFSIHLRKQHKMNLPKFYYSAKKYNPEH